MLIDWFTVVAQALNLLILVWLLKRFLYKPILNAIDAREKRIATALADAEAIKAEARQERDEYRRKNEEFARRRTDLWNQASDEAAAERQRLLEHARRESDTLRTQWQETLKKEYHSFSQELTRRTGEEVFAIARKTLADLASTTLEEQMTTAFIRRLHELGREEQDGLKATFRTTSAPPIVRSAFDLPTAQREAIEHAVKDMLAIDAPVEFEHAPDLVSGIELTANGHKIAWSIGQYLASLKTRVDGLLKDRPPSSANHADTHFKPAADEQQA